MEPIGILVVLAVVLVFIIVVAVNSLRVVSPYEKGVIERVGRYQRTAQPGLTLVAPFFDTLRKVDMREQVVDVQPQEVITKDNVVVTVDAIIYYEATDPVKLTYNVADFYSAATKLAQTSLRNVIGETELDEALTSRDMINAKLREVLDDATDKWGVRIVRVEIKRIDPPVDVTEAMHRQMKAERDRRAQISNPRAYAKPASCRPRAKPKPSAAWPTPSSTSWRSKLRARPTLSPPSTTPLPRPAPRRQADRHSISGGAQGRRPRQATKIASCPSKRRPILGALGGIQEHLPKRRGTARPIRSLTPIGAQGPGSRSSLGRHSALRSPTFTPRPSARLPSSA